IGADAAVESSVQRGEKHAGAAEHRGDERETYAEDFAAGPGGHFETEAGEPTGEERQKIGDEQRDEQRSERDHTRRGATFEWLIGGIKLAVHGTFNFTSRDR